MMPTSATELSPAAAHAAILREATRRLAHHASNVANSAAVNVEVLRSRLGRGAAASESLTSFAERAAAATEQVTAAVTVARTLLLVLAEAATGSATVRGVKGDPEAIELVGGSASALDNSALRFAESAGVGLSSTGRGVILKVLRRGAAEHNPTA
jgi:hypothetical protein